MLRRESVSTLPVVVTHEHATALALGMKYVASEVPHIPDLHGLMLVVKDGRRYTFKYCTAKDRVGVSCCGAFNYDGRCGYCLLDDEDTLTSSDVVASMVPSGVVMPDLDVARKNKCAQTGSENTRCVPWRYCLRCIHSVTS